MSICTEMNTDLTETNECLLESLLETQTTVKKRMNLNAVNKVSESVLDTLRSIQSENPQIETIFIESDEDEKAEQAANIPPKFQSNSNIDTSLVVRELSPANLTQSIVKNANTIALEDQSNKASKKYLIIPQEVYPIIARAKGPVLLHVPGIGPLVIQPSDVLMSAPKATTVRSIPRPPPGPRPPQPYDPLCDNKYSCWKYRKHIKRDLDGFSISDSLGFYCAEQKRSQVCALLCNKMVCDVGKKIQVLERKLEAIQGPRFKMENVKLVEIDKIKKGRKRRLIESPKSNTRIKAKIKPEKTDLSDVQKENLKTLISWKEHFNSPKAEASSPNVSGNDESSDLLVTKKVVLLNNGMAARKPKGRKKKKRDVIELIKRMHAQSKIEDKKSCKSATELDLKSIEEQFPEIQDFDKKELHTPLTRGRPRKSLHEKSPIQGRRGRPRKHSKVKDIYKKAYKKQTIRHQVINDLATFEDEIDLDKPLLIINKLHCSTLDLKKLDAANNVVFPVTKDINVSTSFISSVKSQNVKVVTTEILCQHLSDFNLR